MKNRLFLVPVVLFLLFLPPAAAQAQEPLPEGFRSITLGMSMEDVKEALSKDGYFDYQGESDVSLLEEPTRTLIDCSGITYIDRAFFQFYQDSLYIIILQLNKNEIDFYSMFTTLKEKYGEPKDLSPELVLWESENLRFTLERPVTVKYIDRTVFRELQKESKVEEAYSKVNRDTFIDEF